MSIKEVINLEDGRTITLHLEEEERQNLLDFAVNFFMAQGWLEIGEILPDFVDIDSTVEALKNKDGE
jgi:hypothetical protein